MKLKLKLKAMDQLYTRKIVISLYGFNRVVVLLLKTSGHFGSSDISKSSFDHQFNPCYEFNASLQKFYFIFIFPRIKQNKAY